MLKYNQNICSDYRFAIKCIYNTPDIKEYENSLTNPYIE